MCFCSPQHPEYSEDELNRLYQLFCKYAEPSTKKGSISLESFKKLLEALELTQTHLEAKETYDKVAKDGKVMLDEFMKLVKDLTSKTGKINLEVSESLHLPLVVLASVTLFFSYKGWTTYTLNSITSLDKRKQSVETMQFSPVFLFTLIKIVIQFVCFLTLRSVMTVLLTLPTRF